MKMQMQTKMKHFLVLIIFLALGGVNSRVLGEHNDSPIRCSEDTISGKVYANAQGYRVVFFTDHRGRIGAIPFVSWDIDSFCRITIKLKSFPGLSTWYARADGSAVTGPNGTVYWSR